MVHYNITDGSVSLQLMKTKCEPLLPDLNCICERSRVAACLKNTISLRTDCMALVKYKYRKTSEVMNSILLAS